jgi:hypothetical protein
MGLRLPGFDASNLTDSDIILLPLPHSDLVKDEVRAALGSFDIIS